MIDPTMRSLAVAPAPVPGAMPTPPDRLPTPATQQAHPFAELLRQNRLAAAPPPAPAPPPAASTDPRKAPAPASGDDASATIEPPPSQRDATLAKGRTAASSRSPSSHSPATAPSSTDASENDARSRSDDATAAGAQAPDASALAATLASARPEAPASSDPAASDKSSSARTTAGSALDASARFGAANPVASTTTGADPSAPDAAGARRAERAAADAATERSIVGETAKGPELAAASFAETLGESRALHESRGTAPSDLAGVGATALVPSTATAATTNGASGADAATASARLATPVDSAEFAAAFGAQVSVFVRDGVQRAELHLHPVDMGPVSISITLDGTQARVDFGADVAATRHAIEAGLPELASALSDAGFTLAGGGVAQHSRSNAGDADASDPDRSAAPRDGSARVAGVDAAVAAVRVRHVATGGVDLYA